MFMILSVTPQNTTHSLQFLNEFIHKNMKKEAVRMDPLSLYSDMSNTLSSSFLATP